MPTPASPPFAEDSAPPSGGRRFWRFGILLAALIPLYLTWTFDHSLWNPDETRDAGIASEMFRTGHYAVPMLNGEAFLEKPPLYYWTCAAIYKITGRVTAGTTRLPSALFGILGVLFTFLIGRRQFSERVGFFAACMVATSVQYFRMSHFSLMDVCLAAMVTGALYFYLRGSRLWFAVFTVLAFYAKGFLGVVLPGLVVTTDLLIQRKPKELLKIIGVGALLFTALGLPWFWALWKEGGRRYLEIFIIENHWKRFSSASADHTEHSHFYYFGSFPGDFLPWTFFLFGFMADFVKNRKDYLGDPRRRFLIVWFAALFLFFSASSSKRSMYLLPVFPAAALLSALWLEDIFVSDGWTRAFSLMNTATIGLLALAAMLTIAGGFYFERNPLRGIAVALPLIVAGNFLVRQLRARRALPALGALMGLAALTFALSPISFMKALETDKTFVPLAEAIRTNSAGRTVVGFDMSEMERGVLDFYLGGIFKNVRSTVEMRELLDRKERGELLLIVNRTREKDVAPFVRAPVQTMFEFRPDKKTRSYVVYDVPASNESGVR